MQERCVECHDAHCVFQLQNYKKKLLVTIANRKFLHIFNHLVYQQLTKGQKSIEKGQQLGASRPPILCEALEESLCELVILYAPAW